MNNSFAFVWGKFLFPMQNFTSVLAGRNRDNREKQVRLVLYDLFLHGLILPLSHQGLLTWSISAFRCAGCWCAEFRPAASSNNSQPALL